MLAICGFRDYVFFIDAAVTEPFSQTGSLQTYLEDEAHLGAEAGGKLRNAIPTGFGSDGIMAAVRAIALGCESLLCGCCCAQVALTRTFSTCCRRRGQPRSPSSRR
eukprot:5304744-Pleurochrysis_carterae.AAC.2